MSHPSWSPLMLLLLGSIISLFLLPPPTSGLECVWCRGGGDGGRNARSDPPENYWIYEVEGGPHNFTADELDAIKNEKYCKDVAHAPPNAVVTCEKLTVSYRWKDVTNWVCQVYNEYKGWSSRCVDADDKHKTHSWKIKAGACFLKENEGTIVCYCDTPPKCNAKPLSDTPVILVTYKPETQKPETLQKPCRNGALEMGVASGFGFLLLLPLGLLFHFLSLLQFLWGQ